jgi:hypothetical protein
VVYSLSSEESEERLIHMVALNDGCSETTIRDFAPDDSCKRLPVNRLIDVHIGYVSETLFLANRNTIMIASIERKGKSVRLSDPITMKLEDKHLMRSFYTVEPLANDVPCHIYCVVEMPDSQMSF